MRIRFDQPRAAAVLVRLRVALVEPAREQQQSDEA